MHSQPWCRTGLLGLLWLISAGFMSAQTPARTELKVTAMHPAADSPLRLGANFSLRIHYDSPAAFRLRIQGERQGTTIPGITHASPRYGPGAGEAIAWLAFDHPAQLDRILLVAEDAGTGHVLNSLALPLTLTWSADAPPGAPAPVWVQELNQHAQLAITREMHAPADGGDDFWVNLFLQAVFLTVPGYIILQIALPWWTRGRWRKAAWAPLIVTVPMFLFVVFASTAGGSNLAPIWLLLVCPPACFYLVFLALFFWLKQKRA